MESFRIIWKHSAEKELRKIDKQFIPSIISAIEKLSTNPFPNGAKKLFGTENHFRFRIDDYRVIYSVFQNELIIEIVRVGHRKEVYR